MVYREFPSWVQRLIPILGGAIVGVFVLLPAYEFVSFVEHDLGQEAELTMMAHVRQNWGQALTLRQPFKLGFYFLLGGIMGLIVSQMSRKAILRQIQIEQLKSELGRDLSDLIAQGEGEHLEFKSSYRYDLKQEKANKALEMVIMKTLAGMMNSEGGTLLIGVADDGEILGLAEDYQSLRRKDADGFEQLITSTIADKLGTPACEWVQILFHQQNGKEVCRVRVMPAPQPVYVREGKDTKFYIRTGAGTRAMNLQEAIEFIGQKWKK